MTVKRNHKYFSLDIVEYKRNMLSDLDTPPPLQKVQPPGLGGCTTDNAPAGAHFILYENNQDKP